MTIVLGGTNPAVTFPDGTIQNTSAVVGSSVPYSVLPTGSVLQVVNVAYGTTITTVSGTLVDTGLTATITPKFATSKILVSINVTSCYSSSASTYAYFLLLRNSTSIINFDTITSYSTAGGGSGSTGTTYLDSPATTSATTYKVQWLRQAGTGALYMNNASSSSTITLMEIAG
jgi:hypothetical protein